MPTPVLVRRNVSRCLAPPRSVITTCILSTALDVPGFLFRFGFLMTRRSPASVRSPLQLRSTYKISPSRTTQARLPPGHGVPLHPDPFGELGLSQPLPLPQLPQPPPDPG